MANINPVSAAAHTWIWNHEETSYAPWVSPAI